MTQEDSFEPNDDGVTIGDPSPRQPVHNLPRTQPIPMFADLPSFPPGGAAEAPSSEEDKPAERPADDVQDGDSYAFRRHWREPLLRMLPSKYSPRWYLWVYAFGIIVLATAAGVYASSQDNAVLMAGCAVSVVIVAYPVVREVYRWRMRVIVIAVSNRTVTFTYYEPDKWFLGFNGDGNGNGINLEGSIKLNVHITWLNKLVFWGCGDLEVAGKVEEGSTQSRIENVPNVERVRQFIKQAM